MMASTVYERDISDAAFYAMSYFAHFKPRTSRPLARMIKHTLNYLEKHC